MKDKPISPGAHKELIFWGWKRGDNDTYTHDTKPGHVIKITGHEDAGGGRMRLTWEHHINGILDRRSNGLDALAYHLMRESRQ